MKKHWWKILGVGLLLYTILAGMLIPLGSGIYAVNPVQLQPDQTAKITIKTYNTQYAQYAAEVLEGRIRINAEQAICASNVSVVDDHTLEMEIAIPAGNIPVDTMPPKRNKKSPYPLLEVSSPSQGVAICPSAVFFKKSAKTTPAQFCSAAPYAENTPAHFPFLNILEESIRNLFFHVPMWFGMMIILLVSVVYSIKMLQHPSNIDNDHKASAFAAVGVIYGVLGVVTGALWAKHTWGAYWSWDVKQNTSAVALLIYLAYFVLRGSFEQTDQRARISAIYNIFAFATLIPLLYVVPRLSSSLHPGMGGNPAFSSYDLDNMLRMVFYPSILGWTLLGVWMANLSIRAARIRQKMLEKYM